MNSLFEFTYAPLPFTDESLRGYFERLNTVNGMKGAQNICNNLATTYIPATRPYSNQFNNYIAYLSKAIRLETNELARIFYKQTSIQYVNEIKSINTVHMHHKGFRYCPVCLKEKLYMKSAWDLSIVTECVIHNCSLMNSCPKCSTKLKWNSWKLDECNECGESIVDNVQPNSSPSLLLAVSGLVNSMSNLAYLEALIISLRRMHRPFDNLLSMPNLEKYDINTTQDLLEQALGLLHSSHFRHDYFLDLKRIKLVYRDISIDSVLEPWEAFNYECDYRYDNELPNCLYTPIAKLDVKDGVTKSRLNTYKKVTSTTLTHQITSKRLAHLIGISVDEITTLVEHKYLKPVTTSRKGNEVLFDLNLIAKKICKLEVHSTDKLHHPINFEEVQVILPLFNANIANLFELVLSRKLPMYCPGEHRQLKNCVFEQQELFVILNEQLSNPSIDVGIHALTKLFFSNETLIKRLESAELITSNHWGTNFEVHASDFSKFMNKYICLNRVAYFADIGLDDLYSSLQNSNVEPIFMEKFRGKTLVFTAKTLFVKETIYKIIRYFKKHDNKRYFGF